MKIINEITTNITLAEMTMYDDFFGVHNFISFSGIFLFKKA